ncbi:MAG: YicC/YloC family endoribonuclease [Rikenellaceae bacterium]|nr:YicC/YloC family endoribonuclease [Rikenellaceae bacterium]
MVQSMTGYGKAECILGQNRVIVEIRSVNGKNSDINLKTSLIPREKEAETRQLVIKYLQRGSIDLYTTTDSLQENLGKSINKEAFMAYYNQIKEINSLLGGKFDETGLLCTILKLPDVIESQKKEEKEENWDELRQCIENALIMLCEFRKTEGARLSEDVISRVGLITDYVSSVEKFETQRVEAVKQRLTSRLEEINCSPDQNRLEQEIIFYLEKLDITEEKVRLRQHCNYFMDCIENEPFPGKKLGFIAQEMGREINTLGSKANHAEIQRIVVMMKDELEKIKEQTLNIL